MTNQSPTNEESIIAKALDEIRRLKAENIQLREQAVAPTPDSRADGEEPIAVIGFACRTPGSGDTPDKFWKILEKGQCTISEVPSYRWSIDKYYDPDPEAPGKLRCKFGSFLGEVDGFDCRLFGISPVEASVMDPQQRLLLEMAWECIEDANLSLEALRGSRTGVFIGQSGFDFAAQHMTEQSLTEITPYVGTGCAFSPAAGRISYTFDFKGPSYVVDTACSSSLVAMHNACLSLKHRDSDCALVGAANLVLGPGMSINFDKVGMLCEDGVVKTFDEDAHGVVRSEGAGMIVLKRLSDAQRDGDRIDGIILGSAVSQDGASSSLMAPNGGSQKDVMNAALRSANIKASAVDVVEAHGTATKMGDPTELNALLDVYCRSERQDPLLVGSVKTNFGHMEASAGIIGFIKLLLSLRNEKLPAHLNFSKGHSDIDWANEAIQICSESRPWLKSERRRIAGLSAFGFSGTNAHVVLAEPPLVSPESNKKDEVANVGETKEQLMLVSAATEPSLRKYAGKFAEWMRANPDTSLENISYTLNVKRKHQSFRLAVRGSSIDKLAEQFSEYAKEGKSKGCSTGKVRRSSQKLTSAFVFCGHGSQYIGMSRTLYQSEPVYKKALDKAISIAQQYCSAELKPLLLQSPQRELSGRIGKNEVQGELAKTLNAQLATFCVQYSLAQQWQAWGVQPNLVMGHSLGEYSAACIAKVFSIEDAVMLIAERAKLMSEYSTAGAMICAFHDEKEVQQITDEYVDASIAAINGPGIVLVSGAAASISLIGARVEECGGRISSVPIDRAFHSPLVDEMLPHYAKILEKVKFSTPRIPIISNLTGAIAGAEILTIDYWLSHSREPVQFVKGTEALHAAKLDVLIDVSPDPVLMGLDMCYGEIREKTGSQAVWLPSLRKGANDHSVMLQSLGKLYCLGLKSPSTTTSSDSVNKSVRIPTYNFDRQRCWSAAAERGVASSSITSKYTDNSANSANSANAENSDLTITSRPEPVSAAPDSEKPRPGQAEGALELEPGSWEKVPDSVHLVMLEHMAVVDQFLSLKIDKKSK